MKKIKDSIPAVIVVCMVGFAIGLPINACNNQKARFNQSPIWNKKAGDFVKFKLTGGRVLIKQDFCHSMNTSYCWCSYLDKDTGRLHEAYFEYSELEPFE